ncbi:MAG: NAD(P)H-dependent glycerol-3-phosphate dehydrogenase [Candidatus Eisenbacteria bacterium]|nr:NAD(P)H-dependent glycerol-3-phosphate dehydrogenase [Candidatus Eisenbacteria bacterium]
MACIAVLGAGSWGTTLGLVLHGNGHEVTFWEFDQDQVERLERDRENAKFLPGVPIPRDIRITGDIGTCLDGCEAAVFAVPSHAVRDVAGRAGEHIEPGTTVVNVAKGIENETLMRMSEVLSEVLDRPGSRAIASLVGPSHAEEVSRGLPTTIVSSALDEGTAVRVRELFMMETLRVYTNTDLVGVELGGSLKNIIAIAAGICDGLGYGDNTKGALLTRGLAELTRLGVALGGRPETFAGLSGMGDLITTCISRHSRNRYVGEAIAGGRALDEILEDMVMVAEGVRTTRSANELADREGIEMPIAFEMGRVLFDGDNPREAIVRLMVREPKSEIRGMGGP